MQERKQRVTKTELEEDEFLEWVLRAIEYLKQRSQLFIGGAVADSSGTFQVEIRPRKRTSEGGPLKPGLHSVVVLGSKNGGASAALTVTAEPSEAPAP